MFNWNKKEAPLLGLQGSGGGLGYLVSRIPFEGSGGTMIPADTSGNGYTYHVYTTSGGFTAPQPHTIEVFLVARGGNGGNYAGGGGGGGGVQYYTNYTIEEGPATVTVGGDSTFTSTGQPITATAKTGGRGGNYGQVGSPGGSGGGGAYGDPSVFFGGTGTQPSQPLISGFGGTNYGSPAADGPQAPGGGSAGSNGNAEEFPAFAAPIIGPAVSSPTIPHIGPTGFYGKGAPSGGGANGLTYGAGGSGTPSAVAGVAYPQGIVILRYQP